LETRNRKPKERIAWRKEKVLRLIEEQEPHLAALNPANFQRRQDYFQALSTDRNKLSRLKQELSVLKSGRLLHEGRMQHAAMKGCDGYGQDISSCD
jgi:hypothetical protein